MGIIDQRPVEMIKNELKLDPNKRNMFYRPNTQLLGGKFAQKISLP